MRWLQSTHYSREALSLITFLLVESNCLKSTGSSTTFLQSNKYNAFAIVDRYNTPLGFSLYHSPAHCFNHSYQPNAVQTYVFGDSSGPRHAFRLEPAADRLQWVRKSAFNIRLEAKLRDERRKFLHEQYNFWCECELCRLDTVQESILL
jgi:hypothetical protein